MGFTSFADIFDPEVIVRLVGEKWLNSARIMKTNSVRRDTRPNKGSLVSEVREKRFQDRKGQAVAAGDSINSTGKKQKKSNHPIIWRHDSSDDPDVTEEIMVKDVPKENSGIAQEIIEAGLQWVDDSFIATMEGTAGALTGNQSGTGASVSLVNLVDGKATLNENGLDLDGGTMAMRNELYWAMVKLGLVSQTTNTFGNDNQKMMVLEGKLPTNVLGLTPLISDKIALEGSGKHFLYMLGINAAILRGNDRPTVESAKATANKKFSTITNVKVSYGIGFDGMNWKLAGSEDREDTELATAGNWELGGFNNSQKVLLARVFTNV